MLSEMRSWVQVLDSPFARLTELMLDLVQEQRIPIPRAFLVSSCFAQHTQPEPRCMHCEDLSS